MSTRSAITEVMYRFPADSDWKRPKPADRSRFPIAACFAVIVVVVAVTMDPSRLQVAMFLSAGALLFMGWGLTAMTSEVRHRYVRVGVTVDALSFVPARKTERLEGTLLALIVLLWVALVLGVVVPGSGAISPSATLIGAIVAPRWPWRGTTWFGSQ